MKNNHLEMTRTNFRPRTIDTAKPLPIISDISELYKKDDNSAFNWVKDTATESKNILETEIKRIMELFDKKKTIIIPKVESSGTQAQAGATGEGKFSTHTVTYKLSEFIRPKHYIVYSEKNRLEPKTKDYEASVVDLNYLSSENFFISVDELEKILSALENDVNKGETIPLERAKEIVVNIIPEKKHHVDKICKYWYIRREEYKKSLARKFWKDQKYTDKYLATTFQRREREKMKTRRNKRNEIEGIQKLKEIRETTQNYLNRIIQQMKDREISKKNILILQQIEFEGKLGNLKSAEEKMKEFMKTYTKPAKISSPIKRLEDTIDLELYHENRPKIHRETKPPLHIEDKVKPLIEIRNKPREEKKKIELKPKPIIITTPQIKEKKEKEKDKGKPANEYVLKHRIRHDRANRLIIDRYIQHSDSHSAFDDDFNNIVNKYKVYREDFIYNNHKKVNFDNMYEEYLKDKLGNLIPTDSDEDLNYFNQQFKSFSSSFKQFLKHKRSHSDMLTN